MPDFTLKTFQLLLSCLKMQNYVFQTFAEFIKHPAARAIILRHDVDARKMNSLKTAQIENELGITGTYYFRMVPGSFDEEVIRQIAGLGHEIGYHYEDVSSMAERQKTKVKRQKWEEKGWTTQDARHTEEELLGAAIASFGENLAKLRQVVPVETICMHGSPLSRWDNRLLWKYYDYKDFGITGEPYFDIDFNEVIYLTDTGRRWDGDSVSIRDKAMSGEAKGLRDLETESEKPESGKPVFHSTFDIIKAAEAGTIPDKIMITVHPQRWDGRPLPWVRELVWQNVKNIEKRIINAR